MRRSTGKRSKAVRSGVRNDGLVPYSMLACEVTWVDLRTVELW